MNLFEKATRKAFRFPTVKGEITVEQLWQLPLLARGINTYDGKVYFKGVSDALGYELHCTCDILK